MRTSVNFSPLEECGRLVNLRSRRIGGSWQASNRSAAIAVDDEDERSSTTRTRASAFEFNVAEEACAISREDGHGWKSCCGGFGGLVHRTRKTGERMKLKVKDRTYVFGVQYKDGEVDGFTSDSSAGVNVWPQGRRRRITHVRRQRHRDPELGPQDRAAPRCEGGVTARMISNSSSAGLA